MEADQQVPLQSFTRVHLVPRVNGAAAAALVFERLDQEPLAMSLPLEVMLQVLGVLPQVIGQSAARAPGHDGGLQVPTVWAPESLQWQPQQGHLVVDVQGVKFRLELAQPLLAALAQQLGTTKAMDKLDLVEPSATPKARKKPAPKKAQPADGSSLQKSAPSKKVAAPKASKPKVTP